MNRLRARGATIYPDLVYVEYVQNVTQVQDLLKTYGDRSRIDIVLDFPTIEETQKVIDKVSICSPLP